jgi:glutaminyl-tRNA synthetase
MLNMSIYACFIWFTAALDYLLSHLKEDFNVKDFETACGVGITVSPEEIEHVVENVIKKHKDELLDKRYVQCKIFQ